MLKQRIGNWFFFCVLICILGMGTTVWADEAAYLLPGGWKGVSFESYSTIGGGVNTTADWNLYPKILDTSLGLVIFPWLSIGGFTTYAPLSDFNHCNLGLSIASEKNAFTSASGLEILITPWSGNIIHPYVRLLLGGKTDGYLIDEDAEEGFEKTVAKRASHFGLSFGPEINLSRHTRFFLHGGWQFTSNASMIGLGAKALSGFELGLGLRLIFNSTIY